MHDVSFHNNSDREVHIIKTYAHWCGWHQIGERSHVRMWLMALPCVLQRLGGNACGIDVKK